MPHRCEIRDRTTHPDKCVRRRTPVEPREVGGDRIEGRSQDLLGNRFAKPVSLGEPHGADVDAEPLVDLVSVAERELRAAAAGVEHDERALRRDRAPRSLPGRQAGLPLHRRSPPRRSRSVPGRHRRTRSRWWRSAARPSPPLRSLPPRSASPPESCRRSHRRCARSPRDRTGRSARAPHPAAKARPGRRSSATRRRRCVRRCGT